MIERDWITRAGLRAVCYLIPGRHRCGYVMVPQGHSLYGVEFSQETEALASTDPASMPVGRRGIITAITSSVDAKDGICRRSPDTVFDVHGSLTYSGGGKYPVESEGWWFGFDCAHYGDGSLDPRSFSSGPVRSQAYVESECESLAQQIVSIIGNKEEKANE